MSLSLLNLSGCCEQVYSSMRNTVENLHSQLKLTGNFEPEGKQLDIHINELMPSQSVDAVRASISEE